MRHDELPGIERRHRGLGYLDVRYLLAAERPARAEQLHAQVKRTCDPRTPANRKASVGQARDHRDAVQSRRRVGAEVRASFRSVESKALYADTLVCALVGPGDHKPPVGKAAHGGPYETLGLGGADLALRTGQRILIERAQLDLEDAAGRLLVPGYRETLAGFDDLRQLPFCAGFARKVHREFAGGGRPVQSKEPSLDGTGAVIFPDRDELRSPKTGDARLILTSRGRAVEREFVHRIPLCCASLALAQA